MGIAEFSVEGSGLCPEFLHVRLVEFDVYERVRLNFGGG